MAVDNKYFAIELSKAAVDEAANLMSSVRRLNAIAEQVQKAGIALVGENGPISFDAPEYGNGLTLKHVDGQIIADVLGSAAAVKKFISGEAVATGDSHITNFDKASGKPAF